jgi:hypothetical protein
MLSDDSAIASSRNGTVESGDRFGVVLMQKLSVE